MAYCFVGSGLNQYSFGPNNIPHQALGVFDLSGFRARTPLQPTNGLGFRFYSLGFRVYCSYKAFASSSIHQGVVFRESPKSNV